MLNRPCPSYLYQKPELQVVVLPPTIGALCCLEPATTDTYVTFKIKLIQLVYLIIELQYSYELMSI